MSEEYYSFKEVLRELQMEESELKRLVSEGEIKAINDGQTIKFAKSEIHYIRNSKMDAGTIMMPNGSDHSEDVLLVDEVDSGAISTIEEVGSSLALEAELANESSAFVNVEDSGPLLSMEDSRDGNHPILNMSNEIKKSKVRDAKEDTEELVFEQSSSEDLLETGELLFDSVNQVMPKNKEEADLFTESEMGISDDYDDIDEASVKAAIDFVDSSDEEMVSTSTPKSNIHYSSVEMQRRQKVRTMAGVIAGLVAFIVIAVFFFFPPDSGAKLTTVNFYTVKNMSTKKVHKYDGELTATRKSEVTAPKAGAISGLLSEKAEVNKGDVIASIAGGGGDSELRSRYEASKNAYEKYGKYRVGLKKAYIKYKKTHPKKRKQLSGKTRSGYDIYRKMLWYRKYGAKAKAKLASEGGGKIEVKSSVSGIISQVHAQNGSKVSSGAPIYTISDNSEITCKFRIPEGEAPNWTKDRQITVEVDGRERNAIIENVNKDNSTQPVGVWFYLRITETEGVIPGQTATLHFSKPKEVMAIPKSSVFSENGKSYVYVVLDKKDKVFRREVQLGKEHENNYISVSNVFENDKIVTDNTLKLKDNQDVVIKDK